MLDFQEYLNVDRSITFRFYMDIAREMMWSAEETYRLEVQQLDLEIRQRVPLGKPRSDTDLYLGMADVYQHVKRRCPPGTVFGDLLIVATPPISHEAANSTLLAIGKHLSALVESAVGIRIPPEKLARTFAPFRVIPSTSEKERIQAADRLTRFVGHVVHWTRWPRFKRCVDALARLHHLSPHVELRNLLVARMFEAVEVAGATLAEEAAVRACCARGSPRW
jgi:hypothetical protein